MCIEQTSNDRPKEKEQRREKEEAEIEKHNALTLNDFVFN